MCSNNCQPDERLCPLCGGNNMCSANSSDCWCFHVIIPEAILKCIPEPLRGKACICRKCAEESKLPPAE